MVKAAAAGETTARVHKIKAKQDELPGVEPSDRRIAELEDLGDAKDRCQDEMDEAKHRLAEADENLVAAMRRRERTYYNRPSWGSITITEAKLKAKVKKASVGSKNGDEPGEVEE